MPINTIHTLKDLFENSVLSYRNHPALGFAGGEPFTYSETEKRFRKMINFLTLTGIKKGDRVVILSENSPSWAITYFAIVSLGAVAVPVLTDFHVNEIKKIIDHSGAKTAFVSERFISKLESCELSHDILVVDIDRLRLIAGSNDDVIRRYDSKNTEEVTGWEIIPPYQGKLTNPEPEDLACILYTSGTTGKSKGVMLSHKNLVFETKQALTIQEINDNDRFLSVLPLAHTYECTIGLLLPFMQGASIYYLNKPPSASVLVPMMQKVRPTLMLTVPLIIEKIFKMRIQPKFRNTSILRNLYSISLFRKLLHRMAGKKLYKMFGGKLHFFGIGGAPLAPEVEQFLIEAKFPYAIGYGLTETSPLLAGSAPFKTKFRATGPAMEGVSLKLNNPDSLTGEGEILAKGDNVMLGYYNEPELTSDVFTRDGWFKTGDLGVFDKDGYLYIKGRLKNMILGPSGENIYPEEIEAVINNMDYVSESLVYELKGKLIAKVHLNYDELEKKYAHIREEALNLHHNMQQFVNTRMEEIHNKVNEEVNRYSRLHLVVEQVEPFEKTPTQKIKRYLYLR
ncbi:MAG TPA: AMP-binding protein [Bacteroidales bacterium]|nr:AMP-binding protein [Bacteroidales bacterium]